VALVWVGIFWFLLFRENAFEPDADLDLLWMDKDTYIFHRVSNCASLLSPEKIQRFRNLLLNILLILPCACCSRVCDIHFHLETFLHKSYIGLVPFQSEKHYCEV